MKAIIKGLNPDLIEDIRQAWKKKHEEYYGTPRRTEIDTPPLLRCGYGEKGQGFGWLRSSGTWAWIDTHAQTLLLVGRRHSLQELMRVDLGTFPTDDKGVLIIGEKEGR